MIWAPPDDVEEYRIVRPLGSGSMGVVYLAHDTLLDRPVAIKFINTLEIGTVARDRFLTEARAVARLSHPNVVAIHRVGEVKQRPYLVSEYVRGISLAAVDKPLPWDRVLKIAIGLARGLGAAHRSGVLHRDIKPANVMVGDDDEAKLLDFGLAKLTGSSTASWIDSRRRSSLAVHRLRRDHEVDATVSLGQSFAEPPGAAPAPGAPPVAPVPGSATEPAAGATAVTPADPGARHTREGAILGTPLYLAPELWAGAAASQSSDVYALGVVLYELLVGFAPHAGLLMAELEARVPAEDVPPIATQVEDLPTRLAQLIDAAIARDPARRPTSGDALCDALEAVAARTPPRIAGSPYRGLSTFEPEHRALFFGRAAETRAVIERLRTETLVIVAGDSGVGKSSLCRAAVLPAVADKTLGGAPWRVTAMVPGARPRASLDAALAERRTGESLLIFVDQLEELLTIAAPDEAAAFAEQLAELVIATSSVRVLASARSDFLGRLAGLPRLGALVGRALFLLGPLTDRGLRDAIVGPAQAAGYRFEADATVDELVASGRLHLPLLQFALSELWDARDQAREVIPAEALARIGGVAGALARHADTVLAGLPPSDRRAARAILVALVTAEGTRTRRSHAELVELAAPASPRAGAALGALGALLRGRLLVAHEAESGEDSEYAIAHEALLEGWDTLRSWLGQDAQGRSTRQRLERAAAEWERLGRRPDALGSERLAGEAAGIAEDSLPARDAAFLRATRQLALRRHRLRWLAILSAPTLVIALGLAVHLRTLQQRAQLIADARAALDDARERRSRADALRARAFVRFDERSEDRGGRDPIGSGGGARDNVPRGIDAAPGELAEAAWREALAAGPEVDRAYAETAARLERLLQDDPGSAAGRAAMAEVLRERAELAEDAGRFVERDDLVRRLAVYGSADAWTAPARLSITTEPPGATVAVQRYERSGARWIAAPETGLGTTPLVDHPVPPGSVVLRLALAGAAPVRVPVVLPRAGTRSLRLRLPAAAAVPAGFAYIPEGAFLYGSAGGEDARAVYMSQPIHPVTTAAYLIALDEATFGDWIAFLRALPAEERARRTPQVSRQGFTVVLDELPSRRYRLTLGPDEQPVIAEEGATLRYQGRTRRASQDWSRLPVTGVSFDDMLAYTAWLDASGRVPGARPCSEHEWERAARGADGRAYPHGDWLEPDDANHDLSYGRVTAAFGPDEVGSHPASDSPFGVHDLAGNVWEWTVSSEDHRTPVARGGGFYQAAPFARPENRSPDIATRRDAFYGIRVCASVTESKVSPSR